MPLGRSFPIRPHLAPAAITHAPPTVITTMGPKLARRTRALIGRFPPGTLTAPPVMNHSPPVIVTLMGPKLARRTRSLIGRFPPGTLTAPPVISHAPPLTMTRSGGRVAPRFRPRPLIRPHYTIPSFGGPVVTQISMAVSATSAVAFGGNSETQSNSLPLSSSAALAFGNKETVTESLSLSANSAWSVLTTGILHWIWPGYEYPTLPEGVWQTAALYPPNNSPGYIVANVASGPGSGVIGDWTTGIANAQAAGWTVLGYVNTSNSGTMISVGTIEGQIDQWFSFYGLIDIFFDQVTGASGDLTNYKAITAYARTTHGAGLSFFNVGDVPNSGFLSTTACDVCIVFENTESVYNVGGVPGFQSGTGIGHLIEAAASTTSMVADLSTAISLGAQYVFVTDQSGGNPYGGPPSFFVAENNGIGQTAGNFERVALTGGFSATSAMAANIAPLGGLGLALSANGVLAFGNTEQAALSESISATTALAFPNTEKVADSLAISGSASLAFGNTESSANTLPLSALSALVFGGNTETEANALALSATTALAFSGNTEAAAITLPLSALGALLFGGNTEAAALSLPLSATSALFFPGPINSSGGALQMAISALTALAFGNAEATSLSASISAISALAFGNTESASVTAAITALSSLSFNSTEIASIVLPLSATSALVFGNKYTAGLSMGLTGTSALILGNNEVGALSLPISSTSAVVFGGNKETGAMSLGISANSTLSFHETIAVIETLSIPAVSSIVFLGPTTGQRVAISMAVSAVSSLFFGGPKFHRGIPRMIPMNRGPEPALVLVSLESTHTEPALIGQQVQMRRGSEPGLTG